LVEKVSIPFKLLPGKQVSVRVTLDPVHLAPGPVNKSVWVYIQGQAVPVATLEMTGTILPVTTFTPAALDFGQCAFGSHSTVPLVVTWNKQALPGGSQCRLVSTNPEVVIGPAQLSTDAGADNPPQTYQCTLSPLAHLGELQGSVDAVVTLPGVEPIVVGSAPLRGDIRGEVAASPALVAFGTVQLGRAATRQIILSLMRPRMLSVSSASPYLTAQLHPFVPPPAVIPPVSRPFGGRVPKAVVGDPASQQSSSSQVLLDITLSGKPPIGPLETELTVTTQSGQRLRVPVFALIVSAEAKPQ